MAALAALLTPTDYVDRRVWAHEVDDVLADSWLPVCREDQLQEPGDRFAVTMAGRPLVAIRGGDGTLRVLANVCAHRGSTIVDDGPGQGGTLVCPYHRWAYRLDGTLIGAPLADGVDLDGACLPAIRHVVWQGFVLVNLSGTAADPAAGLAALAEHLAPWRWNELVTVGSATFESTWNWKVMVENWIECYHHLGTHKDTVEPIQPARTTKIIDAGDDPWVAMTVDSVASIARPREQWMPGVTAEAAHLLSVWAAFPLLLGGSVSDYAFWLHVVPHDVDRHRVTWHLLAHESQLDRFPAERVDDDMSMLSTVHRQDMAACARVQAGLASGLLDGVRLTPLEAPIAAFHRWVVAQRSA